MRCDDVTVSSTQKRFFFSSFVVLYSLNPLVPVKESAFKHLSPSIHSMYIFPPFPDVSFTLQSSNVVLITDILSVDVARVEM